MRDTGPPRIAIIGLGYVGLPLALEFSKKYPTIGFDINKKRIDELDSGHDSTGELTKESLNVLKQNIEFSFDCNDLKKSNTYIITVPTPIDKSNNPDLSYLKSASKLVGKLISKNDLVIYESTVFPGATEEICVPILEHESGLFLNKNFFCGYSPERINPGDKKYTLTNITKITSGSNRYALDRVDNLYSSIIKAGTHKAPSIKVAESAKVIENIQRDVNIALINELSMIFDKMDLDTNEILEAASTKWNFLNFKPGLVGGHCIGVDPYYLAYKSIELGHRPDMILSGREVNDSVAKFLTEKLFEKLNEKGKAISKTKIGIFGLTFKEDCPDLRNSKVQDIYSLLKKNNCNVFLNDPYADPSSIKHIYNEKLTDIENLPDLDAVLLCVAHNDYKNINKKSLLGVLKDGAIIIDVKSIFDNSYFNGHDIDYWSL